MSGPLLATIDSRPVMQFCGLTLVTLALLPPALAAGHARRWRLSVRELSVVVLACAILLGLTGEGAARVWSAWGPAGILAWWRERCVWPGIAVLAASSLITAAYRRRDRDGPGRPPGE